MISQKKIVSVVFLMLALFCILLTGNLYAEQVESSSYQITCHDKNFSLKYEENGVALVYFKGDTQTLYGKVSANKTGNYSVYKSAGDEIYVELEEKAASICPEALGMLLHEFEK